MFRFAILFVVLLAVLFGLEILQPVEEWFIVPFTSGLAKISVWITSLFDNTVASYGNTLYNATTGQGVTIVRGCNGIEAVIILAAAIFAFPASLKNKMIGFGLGFFAIQGLNLVRIISLFYLVQWDKTWFELFHLYIWQALIIIDALVVWLIWLRYLPRKVVKQAHPAQASIA